MYVYMHAYICICVYVYMCACVHMYIYIHIYVCIYVFILLGGAGAPLIPVLRRQRQEDLCELKDNLVYRVNSRTARATLFGKGRKKIVLVILCVTVFCLS